MTNEPPEQTETLDQGAGSSVPPRAPVGSPGEPDWQPGHPAWRPPRSRDGSMATVVLGVIVLAIGIWYFMDQTLGLDMPRIRWASLWPIVLILLGLIVLVRSVRRRS